MFIKSSFGRSVDLSHCVFRDSYTQAASCYVFRSAQTQSRTIVNFNDLPDMTSEEFVEVVNKLESDLEWCHFEVGAQHSRHHSLGLSISLRGDPLFVLVNDKPARSAGRPSHSSTNSE